MSYGINGQNNDTPPDWTERIDKNIVKSNWNVGLAFKEGYVFFRVARREFFPIMYDPFAEITNFAGAGNTDMPSGAYINAIELPSPELSTADIFKVDDPLHLYQVFYGISPDICRIFISYPRETAINQLDEGLHTPSYPIFGFIDGFESPLSLPSPRSGFFLPQGPLVAFAFYNPAPYNIKPMLRFAVNRLQVEVIRNQDLVTKILERRVECTLAPIGGVGSPMSLGTATYSKNWGVQPIDLLATQQEITAALNSPADGQKVGRR